MYCYKGFILKKNENNDGYTATAYENKELFPSEFGLPKLTILGKDFVDVKKNIEKYFKEETKKYQEYLTIKNNKNSKKGKRTRGKPINFSGKIRPEELEIDYYLREHGREI